MTLVSVIIPAYNMEKYLSKTVESVISQSYSNTEIIIVNDGSSDRTRAIAEQFKEKDSRIKLINQENKGLSSARNSGIRISRGEIIAFLDSDDWWHQRYLEKMVLHLTRNEKTGISFSRVQFADEEGNILPLYTRGHVKNIRRQDFFYMNPLSCGSNLVIRKTFLNDVGFFDESQKAVEDLDFLYRAASHHFFRISGIKDRLVYYRTREGITYNTELMLKSWDQFMQKVKNEFTEDYNKHYLPAFLSQHIFLARRILETSQPAAISRSYLFFCLKHPLALMKLAYQYPILGFYSFPKTIIKSYLSS